MLNQSRRTELTSVSPLLHDIATDDTACSTPSAPSSKATLASAHKEQKIAQRRCIVTKDSTDKTDLIRFALSPDNVVTPDVEETLPGRGVWVSANKDVLAKAIEQKLFSKAFKSNVIADEKLPQSVESILNQKCLNLLSMARRSGDAILGFDKVQNSCKKDRIAAYITCSAEGADSRKKITNMLPKNVEVVTLWDADTLSGHLGTDNTNHAVLKQSGIANKFIKEYRKLRAFGVQYVQSKRKAVYSNE